MLISPQRKSNKLEIKLHRLLQKPLLLFQKQMNCVHVVGKPREKFVQNMDGSLCISRVIDNGLVCSTYSLS